MYKQFFSEKGNYPMCKIKVIWSDKKVKDEQTLRVKRGVEFIDKLKTNKYTMKFTLLFIYCLFSYSSF